MGCSTFSNFTVLPEIAVAKIREDAPFKTSCYIGCGVTTGVGAVVKTAQVEPGANVVVFGLGGIGLNVISYRAPSWSARTGSSASTSTLTARNGGGSSA
jgi:Zn-dependent alcohol dehydrogenase